MTYPQFIEPGTSEDKSKDKLKSILPYGFKRANSFKQGDTIMYQERYRDKDIWLRVQVIKEIRDSLYHLRILHSSHPHTFPKQTFVIAHLDDITDKPFYKKPD